MKMLSWMSLLCGTGTLLFHHAGAAPRDSIIAQRADGCVMMEASKASENGARLSWDFEIKRTGAYVVQLISAVEDTEGNQSARVDVDGTQLSGQWKKAYLIEEGLVLERDKPVTFTETGRHALSVESGAPLKKTRLVPQAWSRSRIHVSSDKYHEEWIKMHESPEKQAAMAWHKEARFGMFIHWGVYSLAAGSWKGTRIEDSPKKRPTVAEWLMYAFEISRAEYREFAKTFNPDKSFAAKFARLAKETGMKYVVITAKHHDGFALFDSAHSNFDIADSTPYQGDLIKELYDACRAEGLDFGVYYSHGNDWMEGSDGNYAHVKQRNDALGIPTRIQGKNTWDPSPNSYAEYLENKAYPQVAELIRMLPDLRLIWFDGEGFITEKQAFRFYKMVYELNPNIIVNRRVGYDFGDYVDAGDNKTPAANELAAKHFETCGTANRSWGFKAYDHKWKSTHELLRNFVDIVSKGGNYLLNIGPDGKGNVPEPCVKRFREMGVWVKTNAAAVFGTTRWTVFNEGVSPSPSKGKRKRAVTAAPRKPAAQEFWFSAKDDKVYAMSLTPASGTVRILSLKESAGNVTNVRLLGSNKRLPWVQNDLALEIDSRGIETGVNGYAVEVTLKDGRK